MLVVYLERSLFNCNFRTANFTHVFAAPKWSQSRGKYGKLHASRDKLWAEMSSFFLPKASPLYVGKL